MTGVLIAGAGTRLAPCDVCDGKHTVDSVLAIQLSSSLVKERIPLCQRHYDEAEGGLLDWRKTKTPPVSINCPGLRIGGGPGQP
jgi:hypothetical protein